jgi:hypothetical protein
VREREIEREREGGGERERERQTEMIKNVYWSECKVPNIHVKIFTKLEFSLMIFEKYSKYQTSRNSNQWELSCPKQTDVMKRTVAFCNFVNMPENNETKLINASLYTNHYYKTPGQKPNIISIKRHTLKMRYCAYCNVMRPRLEISCFNKHAHEVSQ